MWLASVVLVAGGVLVGVLAAHDKSSDRQLLALLAPVPILAFAGLVLASLSQSNTDLVDAGLIVGITLVLFDIPLAAAFRYTSGRRRDILDVPAGDPEASALDRELDLATDGGSATTVVREYLADDEGRRHLSADTKALQARGYDRVSVAQVGSDAVALAADAIALLTNTMSGSQQPKIVAMFEHRLTRDDGLTI